MSERKERARSDSNDDEVAPTGEESDTKVRESPSHRARDAVVPLVPAGNVDQKEPPTGAIIRAPIPSRPQAAHAFGRPFTACSSPGNQKHV